MSKELEELTTTQVQLESGGAAAHCPPRAPFSVLRQVNSGSCAHSQELSVQASNVLARACESWRRRRYEQSRVERLLVAASCRLLSCGSRVQYIGCGDRIPGYD